MEIIKKYLTKISKETLTHTEVIVIAMAIEQCLKEEWLKQQELRILVQVLKQTGINHNMRKATAKLMLQAIYEIEEKQKPNIFNYDDF